MAFAVYHFLFMSHTCRWWWWWDDVWHVWDLLWPLLFMCLFLSAPKTFVSLFVPIFGWSPLLKLDALLTHFFGLLHWKSGLEKSAFSPPSFFSFWVSHEQQQLFHHLFGDLLGWFVASFWHFDFVSKDSAAGYKKERNFFIYQDLKKQQKLLLCDVFPYP